MSVDFDKFHLDIDFLYQSIVQTSKDYIFIYDAKTDTAVLSDNMLKDFEFNDNEVENFNEKWLNLIHSRDKTRVKEYSSNVIKNGNKFDIEYQVKLKNDCYIWVNSRGNYKINRLTNRADIMIFVVRNLEKNGDIDHITGLLTQRRCLDYFESLDFSQSDSFGQILMIGIDGFATINTLNTHQFGDVVLRSTAQDISELLPPQAKMYRFDGDQFVILLKRFDKEKALDIYKQIRDYSKTEHIIDKTPYQFSVSAGLVSYPKHGICWVELEKALFISLKTAKQSGKDRCICFTPDLLEKQLKEQFLGYALLSSVNKGFEGFYLDYQPICYTNDLKLKGAEALLRFVTPKGTIIKPNNFISLLEDTQLIIPVGRWVLESAISQCKKWLSFYPGFIMNVNVSYLQLHDLNFSYYLEELLDKYQLGVQHIVIELTETYFISDVSNVTASLKRLRELNVKIAMDDFGTGYASLAQLSKFNVDIVKIDRSFVKSLHTSKYNHDFVDAVVRLCHNIGLEVCVEGVETKEEQMMINLLNVDCVQGFYVSVPLDSETFKKTFIDSNKHTQSLIIECNNKDNQHQVIYDRQILQAMVESAPLALNIWDRNFSIIASNEMVLNMYGAHSFESFKNSFYDYSPKYQGSVLTKDKVKLLLQRAFNGESLTSYWEHKSSNGQIIPSEVMLKRIPYGKDYVVASYTRPLHHEYMSLEGLKHVLETLPLSTVILTLDKTLLACNNNMIKMLGMATENQVIENFGLFQLKKQTDGKTTVNKTKLIFKELNEKGSSYFRWTFVDVHKNEIPCQITLTKLNISNQVIVVSYIRDLRELFDAIELNSRLSKLAYSDHLTGTATRNHFFKVLEDTFKKKTNKLALLVFDIDGFKKVNDTYGHEAGDFTLKMVVESIQYVLPTKSIIGRYGGDEFMVLLENIKYNALLTLIHRIIDVVSQMPVSHDKDLFYTTISIGATYKNEADKSCKDVFNRADKALYQAKRQGKNQGVIL